MMWHVSECAVSLYIREVFKARNRKTNHMVALKKVRMENEKEGVSSPHSPLERLVMAITAPPSSLYLPPQFPMTALREIRILQLLKHDNIVNLVEICRTKGEGVSCTLYFDLPLMPGVSLLSQQPPTIVRRGVST